jgi:hypothetical protein
MDSYTKSLRLIIFQSQRNNQWYFHIKALNHKIIASSEGYKKRSAALRTARRLCDTPIVMEELCIATEDQPFH